MRKLCRFFFSRYFISALIILFELVLMLFLALRAYEYSIYALGAVVLIELAVIITLLNRNSNPEYKVSWLVIVSLIPPLGALIYVIFYSRRVSKKKAQLMQRVYDNLDESSDTDEGVYTEADPEFTLLTTQDKLASGKAHAILNDDKIANVYLQTSSEFFARGEDMYKRIKGDIEAARKYIFLEYFIIEQGVMWDTIHDLLRKKAASGVEVRIMYDDIGCMKTLPAHYDRKLRSEGISCQRFSPVTPRFSTAHNNRDHRKILIIDGNVAYTGGINIADEYINEKSRFGYWKDGGLRVEGKAAEGFLRLFLSLWDFNSGSLSDIKKYLSENEYTSCDGGFYIPLGSGPAPIYDRPVGKNVILNIINQAASYVYITTPYLIIDYDLTESLRNAALRGVDVRIITPGIADKKYVKVMTKSAYPYLMEAGVRIYEYRGFIHEKTIVSDDTYALVGTINLDYRSLVHHYEDAVWIYGSPTVPKIKDEFLDTVSDSDEQNEREARLKFKEWVMRNLLRIFAPLM